MSMDRATQRTRLEEETHEDDWPGSHRGGDHADLLGDEVEPQHGGGDLPPVDLADEPNWPGRPAPINWQRVGVAVGAMFIGLYTMYLGYHIIEEELS